MERENKADRRAQARPYWHRDRHADRRPFLLARSRIKKALMNWFDGQGFIGVECGALQVSPGNEAHLQAFESAYHPEGGGEAVPLYLHTSPEFACKKLLAAGEDKIFDFARVFRNGEISQLHAPEFTMVEWYRAGAPLTTIMDDTVLLCREALKAAGRERITWREKTCNPFAEPERISVTEAFQRFANIDLTSILEDRNAFAEIIMREGGDVRPNDSWSDLFSRIIATKIEPKLGLGRLTILYDYPLSEAALASSCPEHPGFAQRFELYACGVELANGFDELTDPKEQRRRFEAEMDVKNDVYGMRYPIDEDFLAALAHMPQASGVALGFDRLVTLASGARNIGDVLWTPFPVASAGNNK